ncbi:transmembrane protein 80-like isoform X4 [Hypanus sabinus]|uniref:transmembrane protein 80-like isoform X4 n=1 Tax=Hypanus sabinus TaxID=79690 RepID=UPI0028C45D76|nr:transmembrane protein 80-like isoform X4 [Hypanus sabinus]
MKFHSSSAPRTCRAGIDGILEDHQLFGKMVLMKGQVFSFPDGNLALDLILLILMVILEVIRLYHGFKGNLTEEAIPIVINMVLTIGSMLFSLYYLLWQTYVLRADVIINAILLVIYGLEEVLDIIAISAFVRIYA